ncbi:MAG: hypothetical protein ACR2LQ_07995 [Acidimicrobiales bacterium]
MSRRRPGQAWRLLLVALVVVLAGACRVKTDIGVDVKADGSGTVTVAVGLDDPAVAAVGDLEASLRTDDLSKAGWAITGPAKEPDGLTYVRLTKPFSNPTEATGIFAEISGAGGPFRDFHISSSRSFAETATSFDGTVDFSAGLPSFSDSPLAQALDGKPLGEDVSAIEKKIGEPVDRVFTFRVAVRLPGAISSNATTRADNGAVWEPKLSEAAPSVLHASGTSWRVGTLVLSGVAGAALLAFVVVLVVRVARRPRAN